MAVHNVERFAFDRIFTAPREPEPKGAAAPQIGDLMLENSVLKAELAAARAEVASREAKARAEGFEAGIAQARAEREVALLSAFDALQAGVEALDERFRDVEARNSAEATEVALAAADLLAARALQHAPGSAVDEAIGRVLSQVARGTELVVRVHPDLVEDIEARVAQRQSQDRRRLNLSVYPDAALAIGDAQIAWDEGGLTLNAEARRAQILSELETLLPNA